jgi:hypothetical protein
MAQLGFDTRYHLSALSKLSKNGQIIRFGKVLTEKKPMMEDMPFVPSNEILSFSGVRETSIPTPQIIKVGDGWDASVVQWAAFSEVISMFKDRSVIPKDTLRIQPKKVTKRLTILDRHIEGFGQGVCNHIIHGSSVATPEKFDGFGVRYTTPDATDPTNPTNGSLGVYDMAGTGSDTTSIWMIQWSPEKVFGTYPVNDPHKGIQVDDMGLVYVTAENSKKRWDYITELAWDLGLVVEDQRAVKRIRNIESSLSAISTDLIKKIIEARNDFMGEETVWMYVNSRIFTHLDWLTVDKTNVKYSSENPYGKPMMMFRDMPIRKCPSILNDETAVAAA